MSILGVNLTVKPDRLACVEQRLGELAAVTVVARQAQGRVVLVIEDDPDSAGTAADARPSAAATLGQIALWPEVLVAALVYEYSGEDSPAPEGMPASYRSWRDSLGSSAASA